MKSPKNYALLVLALTTIGGAGLAWQQYQELIELRAAALDKDERASLQKRIWDLQKYNKELDDELAALRAGNGDDPADAMAGLSGGRGPGGGPGGRGGFRGRGNNNPMQAIDALRTMIARPEVQALIGVQQKARIDAQYASLFKSLNLSADQADKVKSLLADRQATLQDVLTAARDQGINPRSDPQGFQKLLADAQNDVNNSLKSVLGDAGFSQLQTYEQTMPQRNVVNQLQQRLSYTDTPLSQAQADQLVSILAANTPPPTQRTNPDGTVQQPGGRGQGGGRGGGFAVAIGGGGPGGPDLGALGALIGGGGGGEVIAAIAGGARGGAAAATVPITPAAVSQASSVLAAPQVAALQQLQQQQQTQQQLAQIVRDTLAAQQPANNATGGTTGTGTTGTTGGGGRRRGGG